MKAITQLNIFYNMYDFKKMGCLLLFSWSIMGTALQAQSVNTENAAGIPLTLMTYNLKFASPDYKPLWEQRREMQVDMIQKYNPDILATQEGLKEQIDYLSEQLGEYVVVGEGRKGGDADEHMAIFYKRDKFRLRQLNSFALSKTPEILGSGPNENPRIVTWARLAFINSPKNEEQKLYPMDYRGHWKNTKELYVFNTHFFNGTKDTLARDNAAKLIMEKINSLNRFGEWTKDRPVFLMGDFNAQPDSKVYKTFVGDNSSGNQNLLEDCILGGQEIDWVLYKGDVKVIGYERVEYNIDGVYPSDHKPIFVKLNILD